MYALLGEPHTDMVKVKRSSAARRVSRLKLKVSSADAIAITALRVGAQLDYMTRHLDLWLEYLMAHEDVIENRLGGLFPSNILYPRDNLYPHDAGVPSEEWIYYTGYAKRAIVIYYKFTSVTAANEKALLRQEYITRGWEGYMLDDLAALTKAFVETVPGPEEWLLAHTEEPARQERLHKEGLEWMHESISRSESIVFIQV